jgi:hypothetical protein
MADEKRWSLAPELNRRWCLRTKSSSAPLCTFALVSCRSTWGDDLAHGADLPMMANPGSQEAGRDVRQAVPAQIGDGGDLRTMLRASVVSQWPLRTRSNRHTDAARSI